MTALNPKAEGEDLAQQVLGIIGSYIPNQNVSRALASELIVLICEQRLIASTNTVALMVATAKNGGKP